MDIVPRLNLSLRTINSPFNFQRQRNPAHPRRTTPLSFRIAISTLLRNMSKPNLSSEKQKPKSVVKHTRVCGKKVVSDFRSMHESCDDNFVVGKKKNPTRSKASKHRSKAFHVAKWQLPPRKRLAKRRRNWTADEDDALRKAVALFIGNKQMWLLVSQEMSQDKPKELARTPKQCRERFRNHVDPALKPIDVWSKKEDDCITTMYLEYGNAWAKMASKLPGRAPIHLRNRFTWKLRAEMPKPKAAARAA